MKELDFKKFDLQRIKVIDIKITNDSISNIDQSLIIRFESFLLRSNCDYQIKYNGFSNCHQNTSNYHDHDFQKKYNTNHYHEKGQAIDFELFGVRDRQSIFYNALIVGFQGVGIYYCSETDKYFYHFDLRINPSFWGGYRLLKSEDWAYMQLLIDPKKGRDIINGRSKCNKGYRNDNEKIKNT